MFWTRAKAAATPADLDADLAKALADSKAPALSAVVFNDKEILWLGAAGRRRIDAPDLVTTADQWHLGSNTKVMTSTLYARMVEQGRAKWGAKVADLFPDLKADPVWSELTVEDVLHHRSGLKVDQAPPGFEPKAGFDELDALVAERTDAMRWFLANKPAGKIGEFEYSNANYVMVGAALERIGGAPWETLMRRELFGPHGMASGGFGAPRGAQPWGHQKGHPLDPTGPSDNPAILGPAGTAHASLTDYVKFLRVFLTDGGGFLTPDSVARIVTPAPTSKKEASGYGLGWGVLTTLPWSAGPLITHDGSNTLWYASAILSPTRKLGFAITSNDGDAGMKGVKLLTASLMKRYPA